VLHPRARASPVTTVRRRWRPKAGSAASPRVRDSSGGYVPGRFSGLAGRRPAVRPALLGLVEGPHKPYPLPPQSARFNGLLNFRILVQDLRAFCAHVLLQGTSLVADHKKAVRLRKPLRLSKNLACRPPQRLFTVGAFARVMLAWRQASAAKPWYDRRTSYFLGPGDARLIYQQGGRRRRRGAGRSHSSLSTLHLL
jgi:hypothetical protein